MKREDSYENLNDYCENVPKLKQICYKKNEHNNKEECADVQRGGNPPGSFLFIAIQFYKSDILLWFSEERIFLLKCLLNSSISTVAANISEVYANSIFPAMH